MPVYTFAADKDIEFTYRAKVTSGTVHETLLTQAILGEMKDGAIVPVSSFKPVESPAGQVLYGSKDTEFDITCRFYAGTLQPGIYLLKMHGTTTLCDNDMGLLVITDPPDPTAIQSVLAVKNLPSGYYDLQGRRVDSPQRGIYIHSGKKVIIK